MIAGGVDDMVAPPARTEGVANTPVRSHTRTLYTDNDKKTLQYCHFLAAVNLKCTVFTSHKFTSDFNITSKLSVNLNRGVPFTLRLIIEKSCSNICHVVGAQQLWSLL